MPSKDIYHNTVRHALIKEGWTITHDPYTLTFGQKSVFVDLGAERVLAVPESVFVSTLDEPIARPVIEDLEVAIVAFDPREEVIVTWKP